MGCSSSGRGIVIQFPWWRSAARETREQNELGVVTAELRAALVRIEALREENGDLKQRQDTLVREFEQRLVNGLQVIESLLPEQSQTVGPNNRSALRRSISNTLVEAVRCRYGVIL